jgi:hypothetical protein
LVPDLTNAIDAERGGSVPLNSFKLLRKWISRSVMPPPGLVPAG